MVTGEPGVHGAHVTQAQAKNTDTDLAIIQQQKMEVPPVQGHHQCMKIVSSKCHEGQIDFNCILKVERRHFATTVQPTIYFDI